MVDPHESARFDWLTRRRSIHPSTPPTHTPPSPIITTLHAHPSHTQPHTRTHRLALLVRPRGHSGEVKDPLRRARQAAQPQQRAHRQQARAAALLPLPLLPPSVHCADWEERRDRRRLLLPLAFSVVVGRAEACVCAWVWVWMVKSVSRRGGTRYATIIMDHHITRRRRSIIILFGGALNTRNPAPEPPPANPSAAPTHAPLDRGSIDGGRGGRRVVPARGMQGRSGVPKCCCGAAQSERVRKLAKGRRGLFRSSTTPHTTTGRGPELDC